MNDYQRAKDESGKMLTFFLPCLDLSTPGLHTMNKEQRAKESGKRYHSKVPDQIKVSKNKQTV